MGVALPLALCAIGFLLWYRFGYGPLDRVELPLAAFLNGLTGRSESFDHLVIFLNHFWGEAIFVVIILAAYCLLARWVIGRGIDWRPAAVFAAYIFAFWVVANGIGDNVIEQFMPRSSPSYALGERLVDLEAVRDVDVKTESLSSFPSNHGSVFFTVFFFCLLRWWHKAWALLPLVILLSLPRCFTGAHWVSDNLIGSVLVTWSIAAIAIYTPLFQLCRKGEELALTIPPTAPVGAWPEVEAQR